MNVLSITSPDISNGNGCRVTVWVSGCSRNCKGCHNRSSWDYNKGKTLDQEITDKIVSLLSKPYIQGLTISGGDPLDQSPKSLHELLLLIKEIRRRLPDKDIWIYSGGIYEELIENEAVKRVLDECDILVDGPFVLEKKSRHHPWRGSSNQRVIDLNITRKTGEVATIEY